MHTVFYLVVWRSCVVSAGYSCTQTRCSRAPIPITLYPMSWSCIPAHPTCCWEEIMHNTYGNSDNYRQTCMCQIYTHTVSLNIHLQPGMSDKKVECYGSSSHQSLSRWPRPAPEGWAHQRPLCPLSRALFQGQLEATVPEPDTCGNSLFLMQQDNR